MARTKLSNELKKAISLMPPTEKNKLLFRLIAKDPALAEQLRFKLLEGGETKELRRDEVRQLIENHLTKLQHHYYSPGYLLLEMRYLSGRITEHIRTTRDKYGELELNLFLLTHTLRLFGEKTKYAPARKARTFNNYVVKRTLKILGLLEKMHEDYVLDFRDSMEKLGQLIRTQPTMMEVAEGLGLEVERLNNRL